MSSNVGSHRQTLLSSVKVSESDAPTTSSECRATRSLQEQRAADIYDEVGQRSLERLFPGFTEDSMTQATLSAGHAVIGCKRARDIAAPAHLGAFIAAKPRIQAMIQDALTAGLVLQQPLEARLDAVIATATSTCLEALDEEDRATAELYVQKAAQAADEAWQQTVGGLQGHSVANPTMSDLEHPSSASHDEDSDGMDFSASRKSRLSAPQLQAQLSQLTDRTRLKRLKNTPFSKGAWQQVTRIEDLCHTRTFPNQWLFHLDARAGSVLTPLDYITNVQRLGNRAWTGLDECRHCVAPSWTHSWNVENLQHRTRTLRMRSRRGAD